MIKNVYVIFKTHLDLGFTDLAANVLRQYVTDFIPGAMRLAQQSRRGDRTNRFVWTTGSWLVYQFLEQSDSNGRVAMEQAILEGDIVWHALPFTTHTELMDASLFRFGLSLSQELDAKFGRKTIACKMTDVPGHTRSMIPLLAEAGIRLLHIGVNPACTPPAVPPLFRWQEPGGDEIVVMVQRDYGEVMLLPDETTAVAISFTGDNHGPPSLDQVDEVYRRLTLQFPGATIRGASLEDLATNLLTSQNSLPVVTSEIGDTWIHGVGTDPTKVRRFRELTRLRRELLDSGEWEEDSQIHRSFSLPLLAIAEHTWAMDEKTHLADFEAYLPSDFQALRNTERCQQYEVSFEEQRTYLTEAVAALGSSSIARLAKERLASSEPIDEDLAGYEKLTDPLVQLETSHFTLGFGPNGAIEHLLERARGRNWSREGHSLGGLTYQTFSSDDYDRFFAQYATHKFDWAIKDLTKPGMGAAGRRSEVWKPSLMGLFRMEGEKGVRLVARIEFPPDTPEGCPRRASLTIFAPNNEPALYFDLQWFEKKASRLPEAIWLSFSPHGVRADGWALDKMGRVVSPLDVVANGNRKLHAIDRYVRYEDEDGQFSIEALDSPLVAPGEPSLLDFNNRRPPLRRGVHFNLYNNVWGTNFPMWFSDNARFRYRLSFGKTATIGEGFGTEGSRTE